MERSGRKRAATWPPVLIPCDCAHATLGSLTAERRNSRCASLPARRMPARARCQTTLPEPTDRRAWTSAGIPTKAAHQQRGRATPVLWNSAQIGKSRLTSGRDHLTSVHVSYIQVYMPDPLTTLLECVGFDWDEGNSDKNWIKHQVSRAECEELFFNEPLLAAPDERHSEAEPRYYVLGQTEAGRGLFLVVTVRNKQVRVISARAMSRREEKEYQGAQAKESDAPDTEV